MQAQSPTPAAAPPSRLAGCGRDKQKTPSHKCGESWEAQAGRMPLRPAALPLRGSLTPLVRAAAHRFKGIYITYSPAMISQLKQ